MTEKSQELGRRGEKSTKTAGLWKFWRRKLDKTPYKKTLFFNDIAFRTRLRAFRTRLRAAARNQPLKTAGLWKFLRRKLDKIPYKRHNFAPRREINRSKSLIILYNYRLAYDYFLVNSLWNSFQNSYQKRARDFLYYIIMVIGKFIVNYIEIDVYLAKQIIGAFSECFGWVCRGLKRYRYGKG